MSQLKLAEQNLPMMYFDSDAKFQTHKEIFSASATYHMYLYDSRNLCKINPSGL